MQKILVKIGKYDIINIEKVLWSYLRTGDFQTGKELVETCELKIWIFQIFNIIFGVNVVVSKVSRGAIINAHFRYQLRKVDFEVCILVYMRVLYPFMFWIWGQNVNTNLSDSIDIKPVYNTDSPG